MQKRDATSNTLLKIAVNYVIARILEIEALTTAFAVPAEELEELTATLEKLGVVEPHEWAGKIVSAAYAAQKYCLDNDVVLSVNKYDAQRAKVLRDLQLRSARGLQLWPPTSQTIITRMGGRWSEAMNACGIQATAGVEIGRANVRFTTADHHAAIRKYVAERKQEKRIHSYAGYVTWAREQATRVPSGALLREVYGTWPAALRAAGIDD